MFVAAHCSRAYEKAIPQGQVCVRYVSIYVSTYVSIYVSTYVSLHQLSRNPKSPSFISCEKVYLKNARYRLLEFSIGSA